MQCLDKLVDTSLLNRFLENLRMNVLCSYPSFRISQFSNFQQIQKMMQTILSAAANMAALSSVVRNQGLTTVWTATSLSDLWIVSVRVAPASAPTLVLTQALLQGIVQALSYPKRQAIYNTPNWQPCRSNRKCWTKLSLRSNNFRTTWIQTTNR